LLVGLITAMLFSGGAPSGALTAAHCRAWRVIPSPALLGGYLTGVAGTSPTDGWAVGTYFGPEPPIIIHWDGTSWTQFPQTREDYVLNGVDAISASDAWAVGYYGSIRPLALHWNGTSWDRIPTPVPGYDHYVYDVEAISSDDVWLAGGYVGQEGLQGLTMHWDGSTWKVVPTERARYGATFHGLTAAGPDDVWAVGYQGTPQFGNYKPIIQHWDGTRWSIVPAAHPPTGEDNQFYEVDAVASDDVWAVGFYSSPELAQPLIEHWDGTRWSLAHVSQLADGNDLFGVAAISPDDVWAVGKTFQIASRPLALHWDGRAWTQVQVPAPSGNAALEALAAPSPRDVWAVGSAFDYSGGAFRPLTERSRGPCPAGG
jgi:hypothetical protein